MKRARCISMVAVAAFLSGCMTAEQEAQMNLQNDIATCTNFGAAYGSPAHYQCMMVQQQRRDQQQAYNAAMARYNAAIIANTRF